MKNENEKENLETTIAEKTEVIEQQPEELYNLAVKEKHNFTSPLHLACADDTLRANMCCVCFENGWAYASNGHILVKQNLDLHSIINPEKLDGKAIHKDSFKQILQFHTVVVNDDSVLCLAEGRKAEFKFSDITKFPDYNAVIPTNHPYEITCIGVKAKYISIAEKILHGSKYGIRMTFRGIDKAIILTTEEYRDEQLILIMPILLKSTLF